MEAEISFPTPQKIVQQNKLFYAKLKLNTNSLLNGVEYDEQEMKGLVSTYKGYMELHKRKVGDAEPTEYFSSAFLSGLKDKRNKMFSDEIIEKMVKNYDLNEYGSQVQWRSIASNGVNLQKTKFSSSWQVEIENYKTITEKMLR